MMEMKMMSAGVLLLFLFLTVHSPGTNAQSDVCGRAALNTRIVGGENATAGAWPWMASIHSGTSPFCGGFLINNLWILSAAHCFPSDLTNDTSGLTIYLGRQVQVGSNPNEVSLGVAQIILHPDYNNLNGDNDICLVKLSAEVNFTQYILPVCLAAANSTVDDGATLWVTGWGRIGVGDNLPDPQVLQEANVTVVNNTFCNTTYGGGITENMLCAGEGGRDACLGDSGGPLVFNNVDANGTTWVGAGVVSFGRDCGLATFPGVYARVSRYESWIKSHITTNQPGFVLIMASSSSRGTPQLVVLALPLLLSFLHFSSNQ